jgi:hypothetical protein
VTGKDVVALQLAGSFDLIAERLDRASTGWTRRAFETGNPPGFTLWHCARIMDWGVQCAIRGMVEVARRDPWRSLMAPRHLFGAGVSADTAQEIAQAFAPGTVAEYLDDVRVEVMTWLDTQNDATLDAVPAFRSHNEKVDGYTEPPVWSEIESLDGVPAWQILVRPCIAHIRVHIGEVDITLQALGAARQ